ncbi:MAG TPA: zinc-dependent dehydrogenase [Nitrosopumilaceae archaeon]|nr:zinc-dependent dehydrogenase [Nitrosopumilaceae archaeon]
MKTAFVRKPSTISIEETEKPALDSGDILVQMHACGICGSDLEKVFGQYGQPSMKLGHEPAGIILDIGSKVVDFKKGDRVFTHHHVACYSCHNCKHGNETMCKKYSETNLSPCGLSEEYVVPEWNVFHGGVLKLPDSMTFEEAAMIEPLACCVRSWGKINYQEGDSAAIFGVGPTGMMHVMLAQSKKFSDIFCLDVNDYRLEFAKKFNVTKTINSRDEKRLEQILEKTNGLGVDIAIVATSSLKALADAIETVRKGGTVLMFGVPSKGSKINLDMSKIYSKEITLVTSYAASDMDTREALLLIESSEIDVRQLVTHTYPILESQKAFDHAKSGENAMKIIITR